MNSSNFKAVSIILIVRDLNMLKLCLILEFHLFVLSQKFYIMIKMENMLSVLPD